MPHTGPTSSPDARRRIRLEAEDRREQILSAAQKLFASHPYSTVSTTDLAETAGTTRTNLHYYFRTKRELYLEVLRRFGRLPGPPPASARLATGEPELEHLFARWLDLLEENPETILTMIEIGTPRSDPEVEAVLRDSARAWEDRLLVVLGSPDDATNRAIIRAFQGLTSAAVVEWLRRDSLTKEQVRTMMTRTMLTLAREMTAGKWGGF